MKRGAPGGERPKSAGRGGVDPSGFRNLGSTLRILRRLAGISQAELARRAGCNKSQVSKYEAGQERPRLALLDRLLAALDMTPLGLGFALSAVDSLENLPRRAADLTHPVLPVFGGEAEAAMGRLLAGLMRSFLDEQGRRVVAAALPEEGVPE